MTVTAGWNLNQSKNEVEMSDLALALARGEVTTSCGNMTPVICRAICTLCGTVYNKSSKNDYNENLLSSVYNNYIILL